MVSTRREAQEAFNHVLDVVLVRKDDSPLKKALVSEGISDMFSLVTVDFDAIDTLTYDKSDAEKNVPLTRGDKGLLKTFLRFLSHRSNSGNPIGDKWKDITREEFDEFRASAVQTLQAINSTSASALPPTSTSSSLMP